MDTQSPTAPSAWAGAQPLGRAPNLMPNFPVPARVRADFFDMLARSERNGVPLGVALTGLTMPADDSESNIAGIFLWIAVAGTVLIGVGSLSSLIGWLAGIMIVTAVLEFGFLGARLRRLARRVSACVVRGMTLGSAMQVCAGSFLPYEIQVVQAGERAGRLDSALDFLGRFASHRQAILLRMVRAVMYPIILMPVVVALWVAIMVFIYPKFIAIFTELGSHVPPVAAAMVVLSDWLIHYGPFLLVLVFPVGPVVIFLAVMFRQFLAAMLEYVPLLGRAFLWGAQGRFLFVLGSLLDSRVPAVEAVAMAGSASGSWRQWHRAQRAAGRIAQGAGLSAALEETGCLPQTATSQLRVAESLPGFPEQCLAMGDRLVEIQANRLTRLAAMLEPVGVILAALLVAVFVLAIYQTLFGLLGAIPAGY